ncbi:MAG: xanthine dehydrogenase accessory protein XdhC [Geminicoccaceae bacterium]|nr:xanthine dehydrogenase accessory protein XdhC [Geminicoccaceae bacterium]
MNGMADRLRDWLAGDEPVAMVRIESTRGSTPRDSGTAMLVTRDSLAGTIGGGWLEWEAIRTARDWLAGPAAETGAPATGRYILGPEQGQCCGGSVTISLHHAGAGELEELEECERNSTLGDLFLFGAGHVGRAIALAVKPLPLTLHWFDERPEAFGPEEPGIVSANPLTEAARAPSGSAYLVATHSHARDFELCSTILRRDDFVYLGLIGSKTKRARFENGLRKLGLDSGRLTCPIGDANVKDKRPPVIAALTVAELIRRMHEGRRS